MSQSQSQSQSQHIVRTSIGLALLGLSVIKGLSAAWAGDVNSTVYINIPVQSLSSALTTLANQADLQILFSPELVAGKQASPLSGSYSGMEALKQLLSSTDLNFVVNDHDTVVIRPRSEVGLR